MGIRISLQEGTPKPNGSAHDLPSGSRLKREVSVLTQCITKHADLLDTHSKQIQVLHESLERLPGYLVLNQGWWYRMCRKFLLGIE